MALLVFVFGSTQAADPSPPTGNEKADRAPVFHIRNRTVEPLLQAGKPRESMCMAVGTVIRDGDRWRMWYSAYDGNYRRNDDAHLCYAESPDGSHWTKPVLGLVEYEGDKNNNILISGTQVGGSSFSCVFLDEDKAPAKSTK